MQKIMDGLLYDTEKADLVCLSGTDFSLHLIFCTKKRGFFAIDVLYNKKPPIWNINEAITSFHERTFQFDAFMRTMMENFCVDVQIFWRQLSEKQASKLCEEDLSVSEYMKLFPVEEA